MAKDQHKDYDTRLTAKAKYPTNFTQPRKTFALRLHYNGSNSFLLVNAKKIYQFKAKDPEIKNYTPCLGNISKYFTMNNMEKTRLKELFLLILILLIIMIF